MTSEIQSFASIEGQSLRTVRLDGQPWFAARDICDALDIKNVTRALATLDADEKGLHTVNTLGGAQALAIVNESGLYALIMRSRKAEAKAFRRWVTGTVLPALRQGGVYVTGQENVDLGAMGFDQLREHILCVQDKLAEALALRWARSREEKAARRDGFRLLRGKRPRVNG